MTDETPSHEVGTGVWATETNVPLITEHTEEEVRARMTLVLSLIDEHFVIDRNGPKPVLICGLCGEPATWITKHLAVKHPKMYPDLEVWKIPEHLAEQELW